MDKHIDMKALAAKTQDVYERQGAHFDAARAKLLFERKWLARFAELLPEKGSILDAGCGAGEPIAQYFIHKGYKLTGVDFAASMLELARARFPDSHWILADMRDLDLGKTFNGIIGWHSFFHLTGEEQRQVLARFATHLAPEGVLMLTVGTEEDEVIGHVGGEAVYHSSLAPEIYRQILHELGMEVVDFVFEDPTCDFATVLLARMKKAEA